MALQLNDVASFLYYQTQHVGVTVILRQHCIVMQGNQGSMEVQTSPSPTMLPGSTRRLGSCARLHMCGSPGMSWKMW